MRLCVNVWISKFIPERPADFIYYKILFNEGIALCSYPADGSIGYWKVPSPAQSFDVVMKGYFDEGISWE
jgi:hypothetical protein